MCFSASASFVAGAALIPAGIYCARSAVRKDRTYLLLAAVPFVFSAQQFCEGLVWTGLGRDDAGLVRQASTAYLFFAVAFWPFWIPLSIQGIETRKGVKQLLGAMTVLGLAWTWLYLPIAFDPDRWLVTEVVHHSIRYNFSEIPGFTLAPPVAWRVGYLLLVSIPLTMACTRGELKPSGRIWSLLGGLALVTSFVVSYYVFWYAFTSVWCFFAAVLALFLCYVFHQLPKATYEQGRAWAHRLG